MKFSKSHVLFLGVLIALHLLTACSNEEETVPLTGLTSEEAAEQVSSIITSDINGLVQDTDLLINDAESRAPSGRTEACDLSYDTTVVFNYEGPSIQFEYTFSYNYRLNCNQVIPEELIVEFTSTGEYNGPRLNTSGSSTGNVITSINLGSANYELNGMFNRNGVITQKQREMNFFNSESEVVVNNLLVDKTTYEVVSGIVNITASGSSSNGAYQFNANVEFKGGGVAIATIGEDQYEIDINTGDITLL
jgi:hypothetical protein